MAKQKQSKQRQSVKSRASAVQVLLNLQASSFVVTFLVLIVAGVVILSPTLRVLAEQQQEIASLEAAFAESEQQVVALEEQRERWKDPAFVETQARERLLFVYPGDITYLVIDDGEDIEDDGGIEISTGIVETSTDWRESLLASYLVAATTSRDYQAEITEAPGRIPAPRAGEHPMSVGEKPTARDIEVVSEQLGRPARDIVGIPARCVCGNPLVVVTNPRLEDGTPFPTLYYLTQPAATQAASRLEAEGKMTEYQDRLADDEDARQAYRLAHETFLATRAQLGGIEEIEGISAGGMPTRVKCLHSLMAHSLSVGLGVNPVGDWALADTPWSREVCAC